MILKKKKLGVNQTEDIEISVFSRFHWLLISRASYHFSWRTIQKDELLVVLRSFFEETGEFD